MAKVCVFLAEGFEEVEGLTVVDLLRRAGEEVLMVSIGTSLEVTGSHGIKVSADRLFEEVDYSDADMLVLPGGMPGTLHLGEHKGLTELLIKFNEADKKFSDLRNVCGFGDCAAHGVPYDSGCGKGFPAYAYSGAAVRAAVRAGVRLGMRYFSAAAFPSFYGNAAHCDAAQHAL